MLQLIKNLFRSKDSKMSSEDSEELVEKKKCKKCLRRINFEFARCPFCGCSEFHDN